MRKSFHQRRTRALLGAAHIAAYERSYRDRT
jgi:hypothetical protein